MASRDEGAREIRFGTSGYRGRWGIEFTQAVARDIAQAICDFLTDVDGRAGKIIVIGYDSRLHADTMASWCAEVALQNGFQVHLTDRDTPTPVLAYYAGDVLGDACAGVINCTSSHNPVEWQGIKFSLHDGSISPPTVTDFISDRATDYRNGKRSWTPRELTEADRGRLTRFDPLESYCQWILASGDGNCRILLDHAKMRAYFADKLVVIDEMHGSGRGYLRCILDQIGVPHEVIHAEKDPTLGGLHAANPEEPHIQALKDAVRERGAAIGLGTDTDGDRYGIVDAGGEYIQPNAVLAMLTRYLGVIRGLTGRVGTTYVTTRILDRIAADIPGNEPNWPSQDSVPMHMADPAYETVVGDPEAMATRHAFMVLTGLKYIIQAAQMDPQYRLPASPPADWRCRLLIGGEEASGLTSKGHVPDKDGIWACLLVLDMVAHFETSVGEIWRDLERAYFPAHYDRVNLAIADGQKASFIDGLIHEAQTSGTLGGLQVVYAGTIPGRYAELRFRSEDGSIENHLQTRPSGTEPYVRVYFETSSLGALTQLRRAIEARIPSGRS